MQESIDVALDDAPVQAGETNVVDIQDFLPLYCDVHVWGLFENNPAEVVHGKVCSGLVCYYHGDSLASGYLVKLDNPINTSFQGQGEPCSGRQQVVFVHYSSLEYLAPGGIPKYEGEE